MNVALKLFVRPTGSLALADSKGRGSGAGIPRPWRRLRQCSRRPGIFRPAMLLPLALGLHGCAPSAPCLQWESRIVYGGPGKAYYVESCKRYAGQPGSGSGSSVWDKLRRERAEANPVFAAVYAADARALRRLVSQKADVNTSLSSLTPLYEAAFDGLKEIAEILIGAGADVRARTAGGSTPLHAAASAKNGTEVVELLLAAGADIAARDKEGETALHEAANYHRTGTVEVLLAAGADVNARDKRGRTPYDFARGGATQRLLASRGGKSGRSSSR